jgi:hypothetical protein
MKKMAYLIMEGEEENCTESVDEVNTLQVRQWQGFIQLAELFRAVGGVAHLSSH